VTGFFATAVDRRRMDLICRAVRLDEAPDLMSFYVPQQGFFYEHGGAGVVGVGIARRIPIPAGEGQVARAAERVAEALASIRVDGELGPVAVGALPFDGRSPAHLVVPALTIVRRKDGTVWRIETTAAGGVAPVIQPTEVVTTGSPRLSLTPLPTAREYMAAVGIARGRIAAGELQKVVLARMVFARADRPLDQAAVLGRLRLRELDAHVFAARGFVGASPELLVSRAGDEVRSEAVAGTASRTGDADEDRIAAERLLASAKDRGEHALVVEAVRAALQDRCATLRVDTTPQVRQMRSVLHLVTGFAGKLAPPAPSSLELAARLHPTPAVCGTPPEAALRLIRELEPFGRDLYAGLVGWQAADGDGEWTVALRCAEIQDRIALTFAGAGIVADSDPEAEVVETEVKFRGMLDALTGS
jgi:menaquinone-specific isochorismate synthase